MLIYYVVGFVAVGILALDQLVRRRFVTKPTESDLKQVPTYADNVERALQPGQTRIGPSIVAAKRPASGFAFFAVGALLLVFSGLRFSTGTDYNLYAGLFAQIDSSSLTNSIQRAPQELGYVVLSYLLKNLSANPYILFWTSAFLTVAPLMFALYRKSINPTASLFVYYFLGLYVLSFNAIRQSISVAFLLLADTYREESRVKWLVFSAIASLIHISALVVFVIQLFAAFWKPTRLTAIVLLTLSSLIAAVLLQTDLLNELAGFLNGRYQDHLAADHGAGLGTMLSLAVRIVMILLIFSLATTKTDRRHLAFVAISAAILIFTMSNSLMGRFDSYFAVFLVFLLPSALRGDEVPVWRKILVYGGLVVYLGFYVVSYNDVTPYTFIPELRIN